MGEKIKEVLFPLLDSDSPILSCWGCRELKGPIEQLRVRPVLPRNRPTLVPHSGVSRSSFCSMLAVFSSLLAHSQVDILQLNSILTLTGIGTDSTGKGSFPQDCPLLQIASRKSQAVLPVLLP